MKDNLKPTKEDSTFDDLKCKFALESSCIGVWHWYSNTKEVFYSKESKKIIGFKDDEISSKASEWDNRVHPDDKEDYFEDFKNHIKGINEDYVNLHRVLHKDNTYRWILDKGKIIKRDIDGKPLMIIGTHTDITKLKNTEIRLKKSIDLITAQNNKLQSFAHIVSHNLKQHSGNFENILKFHEEADTESEKQEMFWHLNTISKSLSKTLKSLSKLVIIQSKKDNKEHKLSVSHEVNSVINELTYQISESSTIIYNEVERDCNINFSSSYLQSIIHNLITNAIKYKHPNRNPIITISTNSNDDHFELRISDNGRGIDLDKFGKDIFGLYKTFHNNPDAEGVGLYLVKSQIEAFNGSIRIDSSVDVGTTFIITIPNKKNQQ